MTEHRPYSPEPRAAPEADEASTADESRERTEERGDARDELLEAIDHFRNAASMLFERASSDPAVKQATTEAERMVHKVGEKAEPMARHLTSEVGRLTRWVQHTLEGHRKDETPPPDREGS